MEERFIFIDRYKQSSKILKTVQLKGEKKKNFQKSSHIHKSLLRLSRGTPFVFEFTPEVSIDPAQVGLPLKLQIQKIEKISYQWSSRCPFINSHIQSSQLITSHKH